MSVQEIIPITLRIESARNRLIAVGGSLVAFINLLSWIWNHFNPRAVRFWESTYGWLSLLGGVIGVAAAALALRERRRLGATVLAIGLTVQATLMVMQVDLPYEIALAAYVGVLLIVVIGTSRNEALLATGIVVVVGTLVYVVRPAQTAPLQGIMAVAGLLTITGITLGWLLDSLLNVIGQLEVSQARLLRLSHLDPLTGLGNRRLFDENLTRQLRYTHPDRPLALVLIDVDKLKTINDRHGHPMGDKALQLVAEAIRESTRENDSAARIGGDEFGILLPTGGEVGARRVADRIHELLATWRQDGRNGVDLTVSIGVAEATDPAGGVDLLLAQADADMYSVRGSPA